MFILKVKLRDDDLRTSRVTSAVRKEALLKGVGSDPKP